MTAEYSVIITNSLVLDLEILLEVNLNFQVWLTIILACGIFFLREWLGKFSVEI